MLLTPQCTRLPSLSKIALLFAVTPTTVATQEDTGPLAASDIAPHAFELRSFDAAERAWSDLRPLIDEIGDARIVVLGEATHSEGTTMAMKARLAIFLHEAMGFDVLAWEAGILDCAAMNRALQDPNVDLKAAAQEMMRGGWDAHEEVWPLFEYARESHRTARPLTMAGFDGERPPSGGEHFMEAVTEAAETGGISLDADRRDVLARYAMRVFGYINSDSRPLEPEAHAEQLAVVEALEAELRSERAARVISPIHRGRLLASIRQSYSSDERRQRIGGSDPAPYRFPRDPMMGRSFRWLADGEFAGRKIIVWAATAHLTRNTRSLVPVDSDWDYSKAEHMGDTVYDDFGDELYTIAVTSHHGQLGIAYPESMGREDRVSAIDPPLAGSFEAVAHEIGKPLLFVDLRSLPSDSPMRGPFVARPLGFIPTRAVWRDVIDAFLFIDEMEPSRYRR